MAMATNIYGDGTYWLRKDGRWEGRIDLGIVGGKRRRKAVYGKIEKEVLRKLRDARNSRSEGRLATGPRVTLGKYLDRWLDDEVAPKRAPKTTASYRQLVRLHIKPGLGHIQLAKLTPADLKRFYAEKGHSLSPRSVQYLHAVLRRALRLAEREGLIGRSPTDLLEAPQARRPDIEALNPLEVKMFLDIAASDRLEAMWTMAVYTGLRQGELLGLRWEDIDLERWRLGVRQTIQRIGGELIVGAPKSRSSRRSVPILEPAREVLRQWKVRQATERLKAGPTWTESGLVFTSNIGTPLFARNVSRRFHKLLDMANLDRRGFHALRHSTATLLLTAGVHPKVVQELLGHSQISLTMDTYSHVMPTLMEDAGEKLVRLLGS